MAVLSIYVAIGMVMYDINILSVICYVLGKHVNLIYAELKTACVVNHPIITQRSIILKFHQLL